MSYRKKKKKKKKGKGLILNFKFYKLLKSIIKNHLIEVLTGLRSPFTLHCFIQLSLTALSIGGPKWKNHHVKLESTEMRMVIWDLLKAHIHLNHVLFAFFFFFFVNKTCIESDMYANKY